MGGGQPQVGGGGGVARIVVEGAHLRDLPALVVAAGEGDPIRVPHLRSVQSVTRGARPRCKRGARAVRGGKTRGRSKGRLRKWGIPIKKLSWDGLRELDARA